MVRYLAGGMDGESGQQLQTHAAPLTFVRELLTVHSVEAKKEVAPIAQQPPL